MKKSLEDIYNHYEERFGFDYEGIVEPIIPSVKMAIVIPVYKEPNIIATLDSLRSCQSTNNPVEIILVVNQAEDAEESAAEQNQKSIEQVQNWLATNGNLNVHTIKALALPAKHAGVGLARKIGMDEALKRFSSIQYNGLIICLDADCKVESNYLLELEQHFAHEDFVAGNIHYQHLWEHESPEVQDGIIQYELGLRYYVNALRYIGYPHAYHTIGSSMAVSARTYALAGGMNRRKAGEDFYFLHKLIPLGRFQELQSTCVYPSARESDRVPFGTGRAMLKWREREQANYLTYALESFEDLGTLIDIFPTLREAKEYTEVIANLPDSVQQFLVENDFQSTLRDSVKQSGNEENFLKRIYAWLDGFMVLKFIHFARDKYYPNLPVTSCALQLLDKLNLNSKSDLEKLLSVYRKLDNPEA